MDTLAVKWYVYSPLNEKKKSSKISKAALIKAPKKQKSHNYIDSGCRSGWCTCLSWQKSGVQIQLEVPQSPSCRNE